MQVQGFFPSTRAPVITYPLLLASSSIVSSSVEACGSDKSHVHLIVVVYSHAIDNEEAHQFIYNGFINELVNVLELQDQELTEMKAAVLRTLTAIIHLERNPKSVNSTAFSSNTCVSLHYKSY